MTNIVIWVQSAATKVAAHAVGFNPASLIQSCGYGKDVCLSPQCCKQNACRLITISKDARAKSPH